MAGYLQASALKRMINYYLLLAFCPPHLVDAVSSACWQEHTLLAERAGMNLKAFIRQVVPEVSMHIVAFQQATRKPEEEVVRNFAERLMAADQNPEGAAAFQTAFSEVTSHPGRAKKTNRLHRQRGCDYCASPCRYGFFTLMSEPDFTVLASMLDAERTKLTAERDVVNVLWVFTRENLWNVLGMQGGHITPEHLGNLSYCMLLLAMAKSRMAMPEKELTAYQILNQQTIHRLGKNSINLAAPQ